MNEKANLCHKSGMHFCSNMRIEANGEIYDTKSKKCDFEIGAHTRACEYMKQIIASLYDIRFLCSNMRIEANVASYDITWTSNKERTHKTALFIRKFIGASYDIEFLYSNMRFKLT